MIDYSAFTGAFALLSTLAVILAPSSIAAVSCTERAMDPAFSGGGWLNNNEYVLANSYDDDNGIYTIMRVHDTATGNLVRSSKLDFASRLAVTCPTKGFIGMSLIIWNTGKPLIQPFVYFSNLTELGTPLRTSYDEGQWAMRFSQDCSRMLLVHDDDKTVVYKVYKLSRSGVHIFDNKVNPGYRDIYSATVAYAGQDRAIKRLYMNPRKRIARRIRDVKVSGKIGHFTINSRNTFLFVVGSIDGGTKAFKNLALASGRGFLNIDPDDADIDGTFSAYSPTSKNFAGVFTRTRGNIVKIYNSTGSYNGALKHTLLPNSVAERIYFSPDGKKLLVLGGPESRKYWICGDFE